jgi:hypothetical protein
MANPQLKSQLKNLLGIYENLLKEIAEQLKRSWRSSNPKRDSECDTIYELGKQYGKCEAVDEFLEELNKLAHND